VAVVVVVLLVQLVAVLEFLRDNIIVVVFEREEETKQTAANVDPTKIHSSRVIGINYIFFPPHPNKEIHLQTMSALTPLSLLASLSTLTSKIPCNAAT